MSFVCRRQKGKYLANGKSFPIRVTYESLESWSAAKNTKSTHVEQAFKAMDFAGRGNVQGRGQKCVYIFHANVCTHSEVVGFTLHLRAKL